MTRRFSGLRGLPITIIDEVGKSLFAAGQEVQIAAQLSITSGAVSGRGHIPSRPGEPPNNDTGILAGSIETNQIDPLTVEVSANAPYAVALEFGTSKVSERPFMRPAAAAKRRDIGKVIAAAVKRGLRKSKG